MCIHVRGGEVFAHVQVPVLACVCMFVCLHNVLVCYVNVCVFVCGVCLCPVCLWFSSFLVHLGSVC